MSNQWSTIGLGEIASILLSGVDKHLMPGEVTVRLCNYLDVYRHRRLTSKHEFSVGTVTPGELDRFQLRKGDVLITKDSETPDDIGIPSVVIDDLDNTVCGYHLALIRPTKRVNSIFLSYQFQSEGAQRHFLRTANGVTRFGLGIRAISSLPITLPPPDEQAAIACVLDAVDSVLERTRVAVERSKALRQCLLANLLNRGVGCDGYARSPKRSPSQFTKTPLGPLPAAWMLSVVGKEFELQNGFTLNEARRARFRKRRYLRVANVQRDALNLSEVQELEAGDAELAPRVLRVDDLLVVEGHADRMQIGRCARVTEDAAGMTFQNHLFRLRTNGKVVAAFGCLWLNSVYALRYWNARCATSSGLNTINQRMLRRMVIPIPPKLEQEKIVDIIAQQRQHLEALVAKQQRLDALKRSLMHGLFSGAVRVQPYQLERVIQK